MREADTGTRWGRRIAARVFLLVGLGMIGPLAVMMWAGWSTREQVAREEASDHALLASLAAARLDGTLAHDLERLQSAAVGSAPLREVRLRHPLFSAVFLLEADGSIAARDPPDARIDAAAIVAAAGSKPSFTATHAIIPMRSWRGELLRVAAGAVDSARLSSLLRAPGIPAGMEIDLSDATGTVLASTDRSFRGPGDLVSTAQVPTSGWTVAVRQVRSAGFLGFPLFALAVALLVMSLLFGWGAARSLTRPLHALTRAAERMTAGDLAAPMPDLAEDEVGRLGAALERMRAALKESHDELEARVQARTAEVRQLLGKVITAQEHERRRVARELHDDTSQSLAALVIKLRSKAGLEDEANLAVATLDAVHRLIVDLRPSVLDDLGLRSAIDWYAERHLRAKGVAVRCEWTGLDRRLPPEHEAAIFRVVQEAITNVDKHARAESVLIQTSVKENVMTIDVEDDGDGFECNEFGPAIEGGHESPLRGSSCPQTERGWGLLGMRERVEMLGGTLRIASAPGQGTHLSVSVPLA